MRRNLRQFAFLLFSLLVTSVLPAAASDKDDSEATEADNLAGLVTDAEAASLDDLVNVRFRLESDFVPDVDYGGFSIDQYQPSARLKVTTPLAKNVGLRVTLEHRVEVFDFDGTTNLFGLGPTSSDAFDELHGSTVRVQGAYLIDDGWTLFRDDERWSVLAEGFWLGRWEEGSSVGSGSRGGGALAFGYTIPDRFELAIGVRAASKLMNSGVSIAPVIDFGWQISERWRLRNDGLGARLDYQLTDDLTLFAVGRFEKTTFRLEGRPGVGKGRVRFRRVPAGVGIKWDALPWLRISPTVGVTAWQDMRVDDNDRDKLSDNNADPAAWFRLRLDFRPINR